MGRPKGGNNRYWSKDEKLRIVKMVVDEHKTSTEVSTQENISNGMLSMWVKKYINNGEKGLENSKKPGNPLVKYSKRKELSDIEKLEYENMKLRIELERLKKGYIVGGDGQVVVFNILKDKNMK